MNLSWSGPTELAVAGPVCQRQRLPGGFSGPHTPSRADILWMGLPATPVQALTKATQRAHRRLSLSHSGSDALEDRALSITVGCTVCKGWALHKPLASGWMFSLLLVLPRRKNLQWVSKGCVWLKQSLGLLVFCGQGPNFPEMQLPYTFREDLDSMSLRALSIFVYNFRKPRHQWRCHHPGC